MKKESNMITTTESRDQEAVRLFAAKLDYLFSLPDEERVALLGGLKPNGKPGETEVSPKKWADQQTKKELGANPNQTPPKKPDTPPNWLFKRIPEKDQEKTTLLAIDNLIKKVSKNTPANPSQIGRYFVESLETGAPINFVYIKCPRFIYRPGGFYIAPFIEDYISDQSTENGFVKLSTDIRERSKLDLAKLLPVELAKLGIASELTVIVADTDITDVRGFSSDSTEYQNTLVYTKNLKEIFSDTTITTFSQLEAKNGLEKEYRDLYYRSAAFLLSDCTNDKTIVERYRRVIAKLGYPSDLPTTLSDACTRNVSDQFTLPISQITFSKAIEEERASQLNSLPPEKCTFASMTVYTALRIARDIAQLSILLPSLGPRTIYLTTRSLKAVDFGFIGNRLRRQKPLPTIFLKQ